MIRFVRELRLIPIALIASACLLALKTADLVLDGNYFFARDRGPTSDTETSIIRTTPDVVQQSGSNLSWARQMFNFPNGDGSARPRDVVPPPADNGNADITGSVPADSASSDGKSAAKTDDKGNTNGDAKGATPPKTLPAGADKEGKSAKPPAGTTISIVNNGQPSGAERAILERLQDRRQQLDARARELDIRENLVNEAEKRVEAQLAQVKEVEGRIAVETQQKDEAQTARLKGLVTMYANMKPRDAAKIFNRLEISVLIEVASQINPRQMSEILAQMSPDMAERLTVELASKAEQTQQGGPAELPKIQGQPTTP